MTDPLRSARYLNLATFRRNGAAVETPVWFAEHAGRYYFYSAGDAGKVKRLRNSDRARVAACDLRGRVLGPWLPARARVIDDAERIAAGSRALHAKYGWQSRLSDLFSTLARRIGRRAWIEIELASERESAAS
ncbi:MAG TPA: PPOX class F420-dependent oxidoreductase [Thermoanaerobaculia bacterium]|nr:PPOX class F420-dependent oxidoreductase [Thermoanaerobaculia bacterium]